MVSLRGKRALIFGIASDTSIAYAIAKRLAEAGASLYLGYQFRYHSRMMELVKTLPNVALWDRCDVSKDEEMAAFFGKIQEPMDIVVHAIAFAPATALTSRVVDTTDADFTTALNVSSHSLAKTLRYAKEKMPKGGSVITLTYLGGQRVCANYKLMGVAKAALEAYVRELACDLGTQKIRVNAISAGPIKTLAASGIEGFDLILDYHKSISPLKDNVTTDDIAGCSLFLASDLSSKITGQTIFVDGGYSIVGVPALSM